jgi:hypothetical protein
MGWLQVHEVWKDPRGRASLGEMPMCNLREDRGALLGGMPMLRMRRDEGHETFVAGDPMSTESVSPVRETQPRGTRMERIPLLYLRHSP